MVSSALHLIDERLRVPPSHLRLLGSTKPFDEFGMFGKISERIDSAHLRTNAFFTTDIAKKFKQSSMPPLVGLLIKLNDIAYRATRNTK